MIRRLSMKKEKEILQKLSKGSHTSFEKIFSLFYSKIKAFAYGFLKNHDDAEEVTQIIFIKIWEKREYFSAVENFDSYLFTLSKRTILNYIEQKHTLGIPLEDAVECIGNSSPHDDLVAKDLTLLVDMVVDSMPLQRQKVYRMSRIEGLSNDEIAEKLGLQKKTVENHLNQALNELRRIIYLFFIIYINVNGLGDTLF